MAVDEEENGTLVAYPRHRHVQTGLPFLVKVQEGRVRIPVHNVAKEPVKLYAGTLLASYEALPEEQVENIPDGSSVNKITEAMGPENDC